MVFPSVSTTILRMQCHEKEKEKDIVTLGAAINTQRKNKQNRTPRAKAAPENVTSEDKRI